MQNALIGAVMMTLLALGGCGRESTQSSQEPADTDVVQDIAPASPPAPPEDAQSPDADSTAEQEAPDAR